MIQQESGEGLQLFRELNRLGAGIPSGIVVIDHPGAVISAEGHHADQNQKEKDEEEPSLSGKKAAQQCPDRQKNADPQRGDHEVHVPIEEMFPDGIRNHHSILGIKPSSHGGACRKGSEDQEHECRE